MKDAVTPYDAEYPIEYLKSVIQQKQSDVKDLTDNLLEVLKREAPVAIQMAGAKTAAGVRYVPDFSEEQLSGIESGKIKLCVEKGAKLLHR